jgi:cyanophycinase
MIGVGIDEDTAIVVEKNKQFRTLGSGAVYVVDGHNLSYTNISEHALGRAVSIFDVKLHVLSANDGFDLKSRQPLHPQVEEAETETDRRISIEKDT